MLLATQMMHRYSLSVRSVVSVCLRLVRPSVPVLGQFSYARQYSNGAQSSARATATQVSVLQDDSNDTTSVDTKTQALKPVSGLNYNRPKYYWTKKQVTFQSYTWIKVVFYLTWVVYTGCHAQRRSRVAPHERLDVEQSRRTCGWWHSCSPVSPEVAEPQRSLADAGRVG